MFNLGLPPLKHQTPDPCPQSYTLNLQTPNTYSKGTVILAPKTGNTFLTSSRVWLVVVPVGKLLSHQQPEWGLKNSNHTKH